MTLLQTEKQSSASFINVYATAINRSAPEIGVIRGQITDMIKRAGNLHMEVSGGLDCKRLLSEYGTTLLKRD